MVESVPEKSQVENVEKSVEDGKKEEGISSEELIEIGK